MKDKISVLLTLIVVVSITGFVVNLISSITIPEEVTSIKVKKVKEEKPQEEKTKFKEEIIKKTEPPKQVIIPKEEPEEQKKIKERFKKVIPAETIKEKKPEKKKLIKKPKLLLEKQKQAETTQKQKKIETMQQQEQEIETMPKKEQEVLPIKKEEDEIRKLTEKLEDYRLERDILADRLAQLEEETFLLQKKLTSLHGSSVDIEAEKNKFLLELARLKRLQEIHESEKTILRDKLEDTSRKLKDTSLALNSLIQEHCQLAISYLYQARNMIDKLDKMPTHIIGEKSVKTLKEGLAEAEKAFENKNYLKSIALSVNVKEEAGSLIEKIKNKISSYNKSLIDKFLTLFVF